MSWSDVEWDGFCNLLEEAWPGEFDDEAARAWRVLLDGLAPSVAVEGVKRLMFEGHRFRPSVSEVLGAARRDPSRPTFAEAFLLIYGRGGVIKARPTVRTWAHDGERRRLYEEAAMERAAQLHPLIHGFVKRQGVERLKALSLDDPEWGEKHRRDLEAAWNVHVDTFDGREVASLAAGGKRGELRAFDPLAGIGGPRRQITRPAVEDAA